MPLITNFTYSPQIMDVHAFDFRKDSTRFYFNYIITQNMAAYVYKFSHSAGGCNVAGGI